MGTTPDAYAGIEAYTSNMDDETKNPSGRQDTRCRRTVQTYQTGWLYM